MSLETQDRTSAIRLELVDYFSTLLRTPRQEILTDINVLELGADSIMLIEAQRELEKRFGCRIEMQQFFDELNSLDRIAAHLAARAATAPTTAFTPGPAAEQVPSRAEIRPITRAAPPLDPGLHGMLRAQLALVAETIEAQNRLLHDGDRRAARATASGLEGRSP